MRAALKCSASNSPASSPSPTGRRASTGWRRTASGRCLLFAVQAIDTLGAGDAFHGAFAVALAEGRSRSDCLRFASATAALKCTRFGGASGSPKRAKVEEFLKQQALASPLT